MINGLMLDPARCVEKMDYYIKTARLIKEWGYNTLMIHLTDDQGSAYKFGKYPDFCSPLAYDKDEWRRLVDVCADLDIVIIPEVESLGHARNIIKNPEFKHLADTDPNDDKGFNALCQFESMTYDLLADLYEDIVYAFPSEYLHIGCDEVAQGGHPKTLEALRTKEKWEIYAEHINKLNGIVKSFGRKTIFWGDHALKEPKIFDVLDKDIIVHDWCYWNYKAEDEPSRIFLPTEKGFNTIAGPALMYCSRGSRPSRLSIMNMLEMARRVKETNAMGIINTVWVPTRYFSEGLDPFIALCGLLSSGEAYENAVSAVLETFWGVKPTDASRDLFNALLDSSPDYRDMSGLFPLNDKEADTTAETVERMNGLIIDLKRTKKALLEITKSAQRNHQSLKALRLSVDIQIIGYQRAKALMKSRKQQTPVPNSIAKKDATLSKRVKAEWKKSRSEFNSLLYQTEYSIEYTDNIYARIIRSAHISQWQVDNNLTAIFPPKPLNK